MIQIEDKLISEKARLLDATRMYYGTAAEQSAGKERQAMAEAIQLHSSEEETARRAVYNVTTISGQKNYAGKNEILSDYEANTIEIEDIGEDLGKMLIESKYQKSIQLKF